MIKEKAFLSLRYIVLKITFPTESETKCFRETFIHLTSVFKQNTLLNSIIAFVGIMKFWYQM